MSLNLFMAMMAGQKKMPEAPPHAQPDQVAVLERVKKSELDAKAKVEEAAAQAAKTRTEAKAEADRIVKNAESEAAKTSADIVEAGRKETQKELDGIGREAAKEAEKIRSRKDKVRLKGIIDAALEA